MLGCEISTIISQRSRAVINYWMRISHLLLDSSFQQTIATGTNCKLYRLSGTELQHIFIMTVEKQWMLKNWLLKFLANWIIQSKSLTYGLPQNMRQIFTDPKIKQTFTICHFWLRDTLLALAINNFGTNSALHLFVQRLSNTNWRGFFTTQSLVWNWSPGA